MTTDTPFITGEVLSQQLTTKVRKYYRTRS